MPTITIDWFEGRSPEQKKEIVDKLTDLIEDVGNVPRDQIWIRFNDVPKSEWAIGGELQA
jgi:4-oxalocrotonate tautomerase